MISSIDIARGASQAWARIAIFIPKLVGFLVILVIGWLIAKILSKVVAAVLHKVRFDAAVERGGIKRALEHTKYEPSSILGLLVYYAIVLFALQLAFGIFGPNPVSRLLQSVIAYLPKVFVAIVILVVAAAIAAAVRNLLADALGGLSYGTALARAAAVAIVALGFVAALDQLEIARNVVDGLFYAALAVVVGSSIIAVGGGGIQPMQERWSRALSRFDEESENVRAAAGGSRRQSIPSGRPRQTPTVRPEA